MRSRYKSATRRIAQKSTVILLCSALLVACGSVPRKSAGTHASAGKYYENDRPLQGVSQSQIDQIREPTPTLLPLSKGAMRPYVALGKTYTPMTRLDTFSQTGVASWYGLKYQGLRTSSGEVFDTMALTAAHPLLPLPSFVRVTNLENGRSVILRVNDRGPFLRGRIIDVSYAAARKLGFADQGSANVRVDAILP